MEEAGFFLSGCVTFPLLHFLSVKTLPIFFPRRSEDLYVAISTRVVSFLQALCATCVGLQVILTCENIMKDRYFSVDYYAWFGLSYFYYDLGAMFLESCQTHSKERLLIICQKFISKKYLLVLHHIFVPLFGFPVVVFFRRGIGDFFVGCIYMTEMSTPFLCANAVMKHLKWQTSKFYKINGLLLAIAFFFSRILVFPFMYWSYAKHSKLSIWHVPFRIPMHCNLSCLGLLSLQMVWFVAIVKKIARVLRSAEHLTTSAPVLCSANGSTVYPKRMRTTLSNCMSTVPYAKYTKKI